MNWQEVCEHPSLKDLPFKVETNEYGQIVMTPVNNLRGILRGEIGYKLSPSFSTGHVLSSAAIRTSKGTKVADVAWISFERWEQVKHEADASQSPEICVDVILAHYSEKDVMQKKSLYFEAGAKEVWLCSENGDMRFFNPEHELIHSELVPDFPLKIEV
jgi:Uma2 family endonuclease